MMITCKILLELKWNDDFSIFSNRVQIFQLKTANLRLVGPDSGPFMAKLTETFWEFTKLLGTNHV